MLNKIFYKKKPFTFILLFAYLPYLNKKYALLNTVQMKFNQILSSAIFITVCLLSSCVREEIVPFEQENRPDKLVVYGFLTPADSLFIYVGRTKPFGQLNYTGSDFIELNATATISSIDGRSQQLKLIRSKEPVYACSQQEFPIVKGETYNLQVKAKDAVSVSASTTVPLNKAVWLIARITGSEQLADYRFNGSWNKVDNILPVNYGVNIIYDHPVVVNSTTEGITSLGNQYTVKRDIYFGNSKSIQAALITRDKNYNDFSKANDLTYNITENFSSSSFLDIISGYKGAIPEAGNIMNGAGVFGSYLTDVKRLYK